MKLKNKMLSVTLAGTMLLGSTSMAFAANLDLTHKTDDKNYSFNQLGRKSSILREVANDAENFLIEYDGQNYIVGDVAAKVAEGKSFADAVKDLTPVGPEEPGETEELKVVEVSAIDSTSFKVTFNKAAESVLPSNFDVKQKDNNAVTYVKSAVLSEDKMSATVTLYDAMTDGKAYVVTTSGVATSTNEFVYEKAIAASITLADTIAKGASVDLNDYVTVKDAAGNEIKTGFTVDYTASLTLTNGSEINTSSSTSVTVNATITLADGTEITTGNKILAVKDLKAASVDTFKLVESSTDVATLFLNNSTLDKDGKPIASATPTLVATFKDQYGNDINPTETYESLNPAILAVNSSTGAITPVAVGTAYVKVTAGDATKTIPVEVKANPKEATVEAPTTLSVVGSNTAPAGKIDLVVKDQYGNPVNTTGSAVTATSSKTTIATVTASTDTDAKGEASLSVQGLKEGTTTVTIKVGDIEKTVEVTATKAGTIAGYDIVATDDTIDLNGGASNADATIKVYELDENGNRIKDLTKDAAAISAANLSFNLPATGSLIEAKSGGTENQFQNDATNSNIKTGTTTVTVKAGTLTIGTATIEVVNTTDSVASVAVVNPLVKVTDSSVAGTLDTFDEETIAKNIKMTTKSGKVLNNTSDLATKVAAISEVISSDSGVITPDDATNSWGSIGATEPEGASQKATLTIKFVDENIAPVAFTVEVADVTAPTAESALVDGATVTIGGTDVTVTLDNNLTKEYTTGKVTLSEDAKASITLTIDNTELTIDENLVKGENSLNLSDYIGAMNKVTGAQLKDKTATVKLTDNAGNETEYTVNFVAAE